MGSNPCDARTAYILLRETRISFRKAKPQADDEGQKASAGVDKAVADKSGVILALFAKCKGPPPASPACVPRRRSCVAGNASCVASAEENPESPSPGDEPSAKDQT